MVLLVSFSSFVRLVARFFYQSDLLSFARCDYSVRSSARSFLPLGPLAGRSLVPLILLARERDGQTLGVRRSRIVNTSEYKSTYYLFLLL